MPTNPGDYGSFGPTTNVWDITELQNVDVKSPEFKELLVRLYQNINLLALVLQTADKGIYDTEEFVNGQIWYPNPAYNSASLTSPQYRQVFRKVINMGPLQNPLTRQPHGITCTADTSFTRIYGTATDPIGLTYIPLPYVDVAVASNIQLYVDDTNVNIVTESDRTMYTICYVVLEYLYQ